MDIINKERLINKLQSIYSGKGYINNNEQDFLTESTINPTFKKLASKVYKHGIVNIENETNIINYISNKIIHPSDMKDIVPPEFGDVSWIESQWSKTKSKLKESFPMFLLSGLMLSVIYYLVSKTPEEDPISETIDRFSKDLNKLNPKNKKAVDDAIETFKNFYKGK